MNYTIPDDIELKPKIRKFFDFYFTNGYNATQAAKDAGYSERTAYSQGHAFLKTHEGKIIIELYFKELGEQNKFRKDSTKEYLQAVLETNIMDFLNVDDNGKLIAKPMQDIPEDKQRFITEVKINRDGSVMYKIFSKETAREMLNKIDGHYEKDNQQRVNSGPNIYIPENGRNENAPGDAET